MPNKVTIDIYDYISRQAFCPSDADEDTKEKFLFSIGVNIQGSSVKFNANRTANHILKYTKIIALDNYGLAIYNGKYYDIKDAMWIINHIIRSLLNCVGRYWTTQREVEIVESIKRSFDYKVTAFDTDNIINLKNGILQLDSMELKEHSPKYYSSNMLDAEYDASAECPRWLAFLDQIFMGDQAMVDLLQEVFGSCISNVVIGKCAIFYGSGMNGKSVVADILKQLIGESSVSHLNLERFQSRFGLQGLLGKRLNIASELEAGDFKLSTANFKAIVTGDPIQMDIKYSPPIEIALNCKLVFLTNTLPDTSDFSYGYLRRLLILPFKYTVREEDRDIFLTQKLRAELSGILNWAIEGWKRLENNNYVFTQAQAAEECLNSYKRELNNVGEYFENTLIKVYDQKVKKSELYQNYFDACVANAAPYLSKMEFWKRLKAYFANAGITPIYKTLHGIQYLYGYAFRDDVPQDRALVGRPEPEEMIVF